MIRKKRAKQLIDSFAGKQILVVGDLMLDRYVFGDVDRISPEAPVPIVQVRRQQERPGGAANVALNVQSIGGSAKLAGTIGNDADGEALIALLNGEGISTADVVVCDGVRTTVKTRVMADRQQVVRIDREDPAASIAGVLPDLCSRIARAASGANGIVLEDYGKGIVTADVALACIAAGRENAVPVGFDPKNNHDLPVSGITVATPNYREACSAAGLCEEPLGADPGNNPHLADVAARLQSQWKSDLLIITLGSHGMLVLGRDEAQTVIPTRAREVFDVSGAGDTVIAVALLAVAAGAGSHEAAALANFAAGVVVGKVGTASCTAAELLEAIE